MSFDPMVSKIDDVDTLHILKVIAAHSLPGMMTVKYAEPVHAPAGTCAICFSQTRISLGLSDQPEHIESGWCGEEKCFTLISYYINIATKKETVEMLRDRYGKAAKGQPAEFSGALRQFRVWKYREGRLCALTNEFVWETGINRAYGSVSSTNGSGGFYGFHTLAELIQQENAQYEKGIKGDSYIIGTILCFGKIAMATKGSRAEFAVPESLILSTDFDTNLDLLATADRYGMNVISEKQAQDLPGGIVNHQIILPDDAA